MLMICDSSEVRTRAGVDRRCARCRDRRQRRFRFLFGLRPAVRGFAPTPISESRTHAHTPAGGRRPAGLRPAVRAKRLGSFLMSVLSACALLAFALSAFALSAFALLAFALSAFALSAFALLAFALSAFTFLAFAFLAFGTRGFAAMRVTGSHQGHMGPGAYAIS